MGSISVGLSYRKCWTVILIAGTARSILLPENPWHWHDFINIFIDNEYGLKVISAAPKTILNLGANVGLFSVFARDRFADSLIRCYEPNPALIPFLPNNLEGFGVHIHEKAVRIKSGACTMVMNSDNRCSSIADLDGEIGIEAFESVVAEFGCEINLLKIDIESDEWPLLLDCDSLSFQKVNRIVMEYHDTESYSFSDLVYASGKLGFQVEHHLANDGFSIAWISRTPANNS